MPGGTDKPWSTWYTQSPLSKPRARIVLIKNTASTIMKQTLLHWQQRASPRLQERAVSLFSIGFTSISHHCCAG
jgi:hypothetical protein